MLFVQLFSERQGLDRTIASSGQNRHCDRITSVYKLVQVIRTVYTQNQSAEKIQNGLWICPSIIFRLNLHPFCFYRDKPHDSILKS